MKKLNFTVGPVMSSDAVLNVGAEQVPYFRNSDFSSLMLENEVLVKSFSGVDSSGRTVFMTCSGTGSMEAVVMNFFTSNDKVLIINGGTFGQRFVEICKIHQVPYSEIRPQFGCDITDEDLAQYAGKHYTGFLVNIDETSVGVLYNIERISKFCKANGLFLVVDSISSFLCDPLNMKELDVAVMITGSQKALACAPGISLITMSEKAIHRLEESKVSSLYFDLRLALKDGERGQTPFTPAVGILRQINVRLNEIKQKGGVGVEIERVHALASDFRQKIKLLPFKIVSKSLPNAVTALTPLHAKAYDIFLKLQSEYNIWVCPNGGNLKDSVFRVGHIGCLTEQDNDVLINALEDLRRKGFL